MSRGQALREMAGEWDALWASVSTSTPFQSSAWLLSWWSIFGSGELRVIAARDEGRLVGLAPFYLSRTPEGHGELRLVGVGISDYLDVLATADLRGDVARAVERELHAWREDWVFCGFDRVRPGSLLLEIAPPGDADERMVEEEPCPVLALPDRPEMLGAVVGNNLVKTLRNDRRRAEKEGVVEVERAGARTLDAALEALFELHGARWRSRGQPGVLSDAAVRAFHRLAAPALERAGILRLHVLRVGGRIVAVHYGLRAGPTAYSYILGFDPGAAPMSPGTLILASAIEEAIAEGAAEFDFLGGRESYKYRWRPVDRPRVGRHWMRHRA